MSKMETNELEISFLRGRDETGNFIQLKVMNENMSSGHRSHLLSPLLEALLKERENILLDLSKTVAVSSMFFGCLVNAAQLVKTGHGRLRVKVSNELKDTFITTRIGEVIEILE